MPETHSYGFRRMRMTSWALKVTVRFLSGVINLKLLHARRPIMCGEPGIGNGKKERENARGERGWDRL
jgi:hypothetical protein